MDLGLGMRDPNDFAHAFGLGIEVRMPEEAPGECGNFILPHT
jgi:hypothetical protein